MDHIVGFAWNAIWQFLRPSGVHEQQRVPDPLEPEIAEVLFVHRCEFGDTALEQNQRDPPIIGPSTGEVRFPKLFPELGKEGTAIRWEADDCQRGCWRKASQTSAAAVGGRGFAITAGFLRST